MLMLGYTVFVNGMAFPCTFTMKRMGTSGNVYTTATAFDHYDVNSKVGMVKYYMYIYFSWL